MNEATISTQQRSQQRKKEKQLILKRRKATWWGMCVSQSLYAWAQIERDLIFSKKKTFEDWRAMLVALKDCSGKSCAWISSLFSRRFRFAASSFEVISHRHSIEIESDSLCEYLWIAVVWKNKKILKDFRS